MLSRRLLLQTVLSRNFTPFTRLLSLSSVSNGRRRQREHQIKGPSRDSVFALDEADNLEALEDFINEGGTQGHGRLLEENTQKMIQRHVQRQQRNLKKKIVERKYFKKPQEVNLLTWKAKEQIRFLHNEFPEEWTPEQLAESFPISLEGVHQLLNSSYTPRTEEEIEKHDKRVAAHWRQLKQTLALEGGPVQVETNNFQHVIDTGKLPLMINAGGSSALPMPRYAGKNKLRGGRKTMGVFESIVAGSEIVKAQQEEMAKKRAECNLANEELLKKIADSKKGRRKYVTGHIQDGLKNQR